MDTVVKTGREGIVMVGEIRGCGGRRRVEWKEREKMTELDGAQQANPGKSTGSSRESP